MERFYHYYFDGLPDPITILAINKMQARQILDGAPLPPEYAKKSIIAETTSQPIVGVSKKKVGQKTMLWAGRSKEYPDGWKPQ